MAGENAEVRGANIAGSIAAINRVKEQMESLRRTRHPATRASGGRLERAWRISSKAAKKGRGRQAPAL
jgi:hypothetical protein